MTTIPSPTHDRIRRLTALIPLLLCLIVVPLSIGNGDEARAGDAPCERLVPWLLVLAEYYLLHRLYFGLNPVLKRAAPPDYRLEVGQLVAAVLGAGVVYSWHCEAVKNHIGAELSVAIAQGVVIALLFLALRRQNGEVDHDACELLGHELCSAGVLAWAAYATWCQPGWDRGEIASLVTGVAIVAHAYYVWSCCSQQRS